jgi:hypothetical protein
MEAVFELLFEVVLQIVGAILEVFGEAVLQAVISALVEWIGFTISAPLQERTPPNAWVAVLGYAVFGAAAGGLSLLLLPNLTIHRLWLQRLNLIASPVFSGSMMVLLGRWRRKRDQHTTRLDTFLYGFIFALAMALVRYRWGHTPVLALDVPLEN